MKGYLFTSESVAIGHPDKVADQISDAVLDACLKQDPLSRVACETLVTTGLVLLAGEITTKAEIDYQRVVRDTVHAIGYDEGGTGFDYRSCSVLVAIHNQSPEIAASVGVDGEGIGAGDQGLMFGYACKETPELMPLPIMIAHRMVKELRRLRESGELPYLRPDAKVQVTVEYGEDQRPRRLHTVVVSTQHTVSVVRDTLVADMHKMIRDVVPPGFVDEKTLFYVNPSGSFILGGPAADCGLTGRKIIVDTYGGMGRHGGGAFSGKDPTKVDRSGGYAARYVAKNVVAAGLAERCEVQIAYVIGQWHPLAIKVETFGTAQVDEELLALAIGEAFDLTPHGIIAMLELRRPIYRETAFGGHFGREEFTWERTDRVESLLQAVESSESTLKRRDAEMR